MSRRTSPGSVSWPSSPQKSGPRRRAAASSTSPSARRPARRRGDPGRPADGCDPGRVRRRRAGRDLVPGRSLHAAAEPGGAAALLRQLPRHRSRERPALGQSVLRQGQDLGAGAQLQQREAQGQRPARQPDRDRRHRRLARRRHRARHLRRRELRGLCADPGRIGAAPPGAQLRLRQPRGVDGDGDGQDRGDAALGHRGGLAGATRASCSSASTRPGWSSSTPSSPTSPTRPRSPGRCCAGSRPRR